MTLGEKIKEARIQNNLSQEELSQKLHVSRSAVAKWESDKGIPDVTNLKAIASLFQISIDYLLDDTNSIVKSLTRECINLSAYGKGIKKRKKDRVIKEKFPNAQIYTLLGKEKLTRTEKIMDNALGFLTSAPFGIPEFINGMKHLDYEFYLIEENNKQYLVIVTSEYIECRELRKKQVEDKFTLGNWEFIKCKYEVKD